MKKRGISAIVATVLMILIIVAAVGIVYSFILPMFQGLNEFEYNNIDLGITLQGYTVYDTDTGYAFVQVKRGSDDLELAGLEIIFYIGGESVTYEIEKDEVPKPNEKKTYQRNLRAAGYGAPDSVAVAPIFLVEGKTVRGEVSSKVVIPRNNVQLTDVEKANLESSVGNEFPKGYWQGWTKLTGCSDLNLAGGKYYLDNNLEVLNGDLRSDGSCFSIVADNIIFNLRGKKVRGTNNNGRAVNVNANSVEVSGGTFAGFDSVIQVGAVTNAKLSGLVFNCEAISTCATAVSMDGSDSNLLSNLNIQGYDNGIYLLNSDSNRVENIFAFNNDNHGVYSVDGKSNVFVNVNSSENNGNGIFIDNSATDDGNNGNVVEGGVFLSNAVSGISFYQSGGNSLSSLVSEYNSQEDYYCYNSAGISLTGVKFCKVELILGCDANAVMDPSCLSCNTDTECQDRFDLAYICDDTNQCLYD